MTEDEAEVMRLENEEMRSAMETQGIGWAVKQMREGRRVAREGWNGKGQYLGMNEPGPSSEMQQPYVWIRTVQGDRVPWLCSQTDLLAQDWELA